MEKRKKRLWELCRPHRAPRKASALADDPLGIQMLGIGETTELRGATFMVMRWKGERNIQQCRSCALFGSDMCSLGCESKNRPDRCNIVVKNIMPPIVH